MGLLMNQTFGAVRRITETILTRWVGGKYEDYVLDPGVVERLKRPAAINPDDDHFNHPTLAAKWSRLNSSPTLSLSALPGWLNLGGWVGQPVPSGNWTIETEMIVSTMPSPEYNTAGLALFSGSNLSAMTHHNFAFGFENNVINSIIQVNRWVNGGYSSTLAQNTGLPMMTDEMFLRMVKSGTNYYMEYSRNGKRWTRWTTITEGTLGYTPTYFGLMGGGNGGTFFNYFIRR